MNEYLNLMTIQGMTILELLDRHGLRSGDAQIMHRDIYHRKTLTNDVATDIAFFNDTDASGLWVTNMRESGKFGANEAFIALGLSVLIIPGGTVSAVGAQAAFGRTNDLEYIAHKASVLQLEYDGNSNVWADGPLVKFPPGYQVGGTHFATDQSTIANDKQTRVDLPAVVGQRYELRKPWGFEPLRNFNMKLKAGSAWALPTDTNAELIVTMHGLYATSTKRK